MQFALIDAIIEANTARPAVSRQLRLPDIRAGFLFLPPQYKMPYSKPYLPLSDQLSLLKQRGLQVADDAAAVDCLRRNGYYRLSAYWYPFREISAGRRTDRFLKNSHFENAVKLYSFDKKFKLLLLDALERVEIAVRAEIALLLGGRDPFAYTNPSLLHPRFVSRQPPNNISKHDEWLDKFDKQVRRSKDEFVLHHNRQYGPNSPLPIWIAIELWDFGTLSHFYGGLQVKDREAVATRFSVPDWRLMESWLMALNYVRNVIAHHGRLWNSNLSLNPRLPRRGEMPDFDALLPLYNASARVYSICCILSHLSKVTNASSPWPNELKTFVEGFPPMPYASAQDMGFPSGWQTHGFWR